MIYTECLKNKSKEELFALGKKIVEEFADVNNLLMPRINKIGFNYRFPDNRGCYHLGEIEICMDNCSDPVKGEPVRRWTYPCYKADVTALGVLAHEFGHHVAFKKNLRVPQIGSVSGYESNHHEVSAESLRLFILNPDLLRVIAPVRYLYLMGHLKPVVTQPWREVLQGAGNRYFEVIEKFEKKLEKRFGSSKY